MEVITHKIESLDNDILDQELHRGNRDIVEHRLVKTLSGSGLYIEKTMRIEPLLTFLIQDKLSQLCIKNFQEK